MERACLTPQVLFEQVYLMLGLDLLLEQGPELVQGLELELELELGLGLGLELEPEPMLEQEELEQGPMLESPLLEQGPVLD